MTTDIITFGCRLNTYESEIMQQHADTLQLKNTIIINTCAVTQEAERQARQKIRQLRRNNPESRIIVTGCAAQINPEKWHNMPEVNAVLGNREKLTEAGLQAASQETHIVSDIMNLEETAHHLMIDHLSGHARAFVQIQQGCNHRCTFCIIPFGRGPNVSVPVGQIVTQIQHLIRQGYQDIALTGVDITDYGDNLPGNPTLTQLCRRILHLVPELPRLRLSSLDVAELDDDFFDLLAGEPRLMPHLHLSIQSGDNMILKRMKRRHSREDVLEFCHKARLARPDIVFGGDFITGFPTETEDMFQNTYNLIKQANISFLHVFPYSEREGTPAARMPQIAKDIRKMRGKILRELNQNMSDTLFKTFHNKTVPVMIEQEGKAHTPHFIPVHMCTETPFEEGKIIQVRLEHQPETPYMLGHFIHA